MVVEHQPWSIYLWLSILNERIRPPAEWRFPLCQRDTTNRAVVAVQVPARRRHQTIPTDDKAVANIKSSRSVNEPFSLFSIFLMSSLYRSLLSCAQQSATSYTWEYHPHDCSWKSTRPTKLPAIILVWKQIHQFCIECEQLPSWAISLTRVIAHGTCYQPSITFTDKCPDSINEYLSTSSTTWSSIDFLSLRTTTTSWVSQRKWFRYDCLTMRDLIVPIRLDSYFNEHESFRDSTISVATTRRTSFVSFEWVHDENQSSRKTYVACRWSILRTGCVGKASLSTQFKWWRIRSLDDVWLVFSRRSDSSWMYFVVASLLLLFYHSS